MTVTVVIFGPACPPKLLWAESLVDRPLIGPVAHVRLAEGHDMSIQSDIRIAPRNRLLTFRPCIATVVCE
jgi:hypothetical protein